MTIPGMGGQVPARPDQQYIGQQGVPVAPGSQSQLIRVTEIVVTPGSILQGIFTYSSNPPAAGTLVESASVSVAGTDQYGNHYVAGHASYGAGFAAALNAGFVVFYTGSLAGGWTAGAQVLTDSSGDLLLVAASGRQITAGSNTLDDGSGNAIVVGTLSVNGSTSTGAGSNGGVTSGPSGTVNAFPAAGPNHTHAEAHTHPL